MFNFGHRKEVLLEAYAGMNDKFFEMIDKRRQEIKLLKEQKHSGDEFNSAQPSKDLLSLMIEASDDAESADEGHAGSKSSLSTEELRDNLFLFFVAGRCKDEHYALPSPRQSYSSFESNKHQS